MFNRHKRSTHGVGAASWQQGKASGPRSPSELGMARALSEATQAAAAAATAAAHAASACRPKLEKPT